MRAIQEFRGGVAIWAVVLIFLVMGGCAGTSSSLQEEDGKELADHAFSAKAMLQKADQLFKDKEYVEAQQEYRSFLDLHPVHASAAYAQYRIALSAFHQIDTIDRDMGPVYQALDAFQTLLLVYPGTPYTDEALSKMHSVKNRLAERDFYIGHFYLQKRAYPAAIERFKKLLKEFPDASASEKSLYYLGIAYGASGAETQAIESLETFLKQYPSSPYKAEASAILIRINSKEKAL